MIIVRVELLSAINGRTTELARMHICNDGQASVQNPRLGDYTVATLRGRDKDTLDKRVTQRSGRVTGHRRLDLHVWVLVAKALKAVGYAE